MEENKMEDWVIVEHNNNFRDIDDAKSGSKLGWILETWLSLGKNAVMTGVIISSIPILVPPIVVIAALGCAFSLPLGFVFATYTCTNKLIAKLLPGPVPAPSPPPYYYPEGEEKQMEAAVKDDAETRIELVDDINDDFDQETGDEVDNNNKNNNYEPPVGPVGPEPATINAEAVDLYAAAAAAEAEEKATQVVKTSAVPEGKKGIVLDDNEKAGQEEDKQAPSAGSDDSSLVEEHEVIVDDNDHDVGELGQSVDISKTGTGESYDQAKAVADDGELKHDNDQRTRVVDGVDVDVVFSEIAVDVVTTDEGVVDKKIEVRSVTIYNEPAGGSDNQTKAKTVADDDKVKEEIKDARVVGDGARSDEGLLGEDEEIQKKMEGIRAIVGYKGPKGNSDMEELKALYVFIGIEPPTDSADFQNQLRFLMSVIGLK